MVLRRDRRSGVRHVPTVNLDEVTGYTALWLHLATLTCILTLWSSMLCMVAEVALNPEPVPLSAAATEERNFLRCSDTLVCKLSIEN